VHHKRDAKIQIFALQLQYITSEMNVFLEVFVINMIVWRS